MFGGYQKLLTKEITIAPPCHINICSTFLAGEDLAALAGILCLMKKGNGQTKVKLETKVNDKTKDEIGLFSALFPIQNYLLLEI